MVVPQVPASTAATSDNDPMASAAAGSVVLAPHGQQTDLWSISEADDQFVMLGQRCQNPRGLTHVMQLNLGIWFLTSAQKCVATQGDQDAHLSEPARRSEPP